MAEQNPIWDALTEHFGEARTASERSRRGKAVKELKEAEATPEEIRIAIDFCRKNFTSFTEMAVCSWLSRALYEQKKGGQSFLRLIEGGK